MYLFLDCYGFEWLTISGLTWVGLFGLAGQRCAKSQASVRGAALAVATVEGCFLHCTVSSVTGQCEAFSRVLAAVKLWVHCGHCAGSMPLLIPTDWSERLFFFLLGWKSKLCFLGPQAHSGDARPCGFMWTCWPVEMCFFFFTSWWCLRRLLSGMSTFQKMLPRKRHV